MGNFASSKAVTFLDIETTQLDPKKSAILQISFITDWENGKQDSWSTKIKPKPIELEFASKEALAICNYTEEGWENAVFARYKWTEVDSVKNLDDEQTFKVGYPIIDTCALAYLFLPTERQNLNELRQYFNISTDGAHEAVKDTEDCRTVFYNIIGEKLDKD